MESLALRLLVEADQLRAELTPLPLRLADAFTASGAHSGSRLRVLTYDGIPGFGLARADERRAVVVPRITGPQPEARPLALVFHSGTDEAFSRWFDDSVDAINGELFDQRDIP